MLIAGAIDTIIYMLTKNTALSVVFILSAIAGSVMMLTKDQSNVSVVDQMIFMIRFSKSQKRYRYRYLDEWGMEEN